MEAGVSVYSKTEDLCNPRKVNLSVPVWTHNRNYIAWTLYKFIISLLYFSSAEVAHGNGS